MYIRKTIDSWDIMANYGYGWECECSANTRKEASQNLKDYQNNGSGQYYIKKTRTKIMLDK